MTRCEIQSSTIETVGYSFGKLWIKFKSGLTYEYDKVPRSMFDGLLSADSAGHYFHVNIRGKFHYTRLSNDPLERMRQRRENAATS